MHGSRRDGVADLCGAADRLGRDPESAVDDRNALDRASLCNALRRRIAEVCTHYTDGAMQSQEPVAGFRMPRIYSKMAFGTLTMLESSGNMSLRYG